MKQLSCFSFLLFSYLMVTAQVNVVFNVSDTSSTHLQDNIYLAGNFNNWNPKDSNYLLSKTTSGQYELKLSMNFGTYEFKYTRGNWNSVECLANGADIENHLIRLFNDTIIKVNIAGWKDDFAIVPSKKTATAQVHILDTAFFIPQLNRFRRIWIYLPQGYEKNKKHYPVLYMHDGQNLFDEAASGFGEWGVDEILDSLMNAGKKDCIVVGIDNGPRRMNEYNPYAFGQYGEGEGDQYLAFLVHTLKPFIDSAYRTLKSKENTVIAGSSMGGLISYYASLQHPEVFGKAGIFSPAFWTALPIKAVSDSLAGKLTGKLFFYMGELEGEAYLQDMEDVLTIIGKKSPALIYTITDPDGSHHEKAWRKWFAEFYNWILADGFNNVINTKD